MSTLYVILRFVVTNWEGVRQFLGGCIGSVPLLDIHSLNLTVPTMLARRGEDCVDAFVGWLRRNEANLTDEDIGTMMRTLGQ